MVKKERSLTGAPSLLTRWRRGQPPQPPHHTPFSGHYVFTFEGNPFVQGPSNQLVDRFIPAKGTGHADLLGSSTLYVGLGIDVIKNPLQGHINLLFQANDGTQLYAGGDMSCTAADNKGQVAFAGVMAIEGGTGCYRGSQGTLTLTGTLHGVNGTGTLTFNGSVSMQASA